MPVNFETMQRILNEAERHLQQIPLLTKVSKVTSLKIIHILLVLGILLRYIRISTLVGLIYPVWSSLKAIKSKQTDQDTFTFWLSYWVIYGILAVFESTTNLLFWIPFYELIKIFFYLYLFLPQYKGALMLLSN